MFRKDKHLNFIYIQQTALRSLFFLYRFIIALFHHLKKGGLCRGKYKSLS